MANRIKGLTVEIGGDTTKLSKALENVNKKSRDLSAELGDINRLLKLDPGNTELLTQKQKVLADMISNTKEKLDTLREAEKQVQQQFERGEASEDQYMALKREIIDTTKKLENCERAARETNDAIGNLGKDSGDAGSQLDDLAEGANKAERNSDKLGDTLSGPAKTGFLVFAGAAAGAVTTLVGAAEASREYRAEMGKLDTAYQSSGHTSEAARETYKELQSVLGETDQAVEAANHLAKLTDNERDLQKWTEICTGVFATFGASLPIEGLTEAANETAKVGKVTGPLADAINWSTSSTEDWSDALKGNKKALGAFKKAVEKGESAEDAFNSALDTCSDAQERQSLIADTLIGLYGDAAKQYKKTNEKVIEANKANEAWNESMAKLGDKMDPVISDVKLFGAELLDSAEKPAKKVADYVTKKLIPALRSIKDWASGNMPVITGTVAGLTGTVVAYKAATAIAKLATDGFKTTLLATKVAQEALNLAQSLTPWGLAAVAIEGLVTGLGVYIGATQDAAREAGILTDKERDLMDAANDAAKALRDQREDTNKAEGDYMSQMGHIQDLATELQNLADASGRVKDKDKERADYILGELNTALGTEYTMTGNAIDNYSKLVRGIDEVIAAKTAEKLLELNNADYLQALQNKNDALQNLCLAEKDYQNQKDITKQKEKEYQEASAAVQKLIDEQGMSSYAAMQTAEGQKQILLFQSLETERKTLEEKKGIYEDAARAYGENSALITDYEDAQVAAAQGNYDRVKEILLGKGMSFGDYADTVDDETRRAIDSLYKEAVDAGLAAEDTKKKFEEGVDGYTKEMVEEAEKAYEDAMGAFADARLDAEGVGKDIGDGMVSGMEGKRTSLISKIRSLVADIISASRDEADSHSPSRKMIRLGEDMDDGLMVGMQNKTKLMLRTAREQVADIIGAFSNLDDMPPQAAYNGVQSGSMRRQTQSYQATADSTAAKLDRILEAIERGQVITLDGDTLVGATAGRMDSVLGRRRALAARGAY